MDQFLSALRERGVPEDNVARMAQDRVKQLHNLRVIRPATDGIHVQSFRTKWESQLLFPATVRQQVPLKQIDQDVVKFLGEDRLSTFIPRYGDRVFARNWKQLSSHEKIEDA